MTIDPVASEILANVLAVVFLVASMHKLLHRKIFRRALEAYALIPRFMVSPLATALGLLELSVAVSLVTPIAYYAGLLAAFLLATYAGAMAISLTFRRSDIDCGCSLSGVRRPVQRWMLIRNGVLILAALAMEVAPESRTLSAIDWATIAGGTCALLLLYWTAEGLLVVRHPRGVGDV